jgi:putative holliday junction resolvase
MKRIMGLDPGEKRIGIALSDPLGITAQPYAVIEKNSGSKLIEKLKEIIEKKDVGKIVVGMPYSLKGEKGESAEKTMEFIRYLNKNTGIEIEITDERFTTAFSERVMLEGNASRKKRRQNIDKIAASVMLQGYLDRKGE